MGRAIAFLLGCCAVGHAQWPGAEFRPEPGTGALRSRYDHAAWTSPESLVHDLRSDVDSVRARALRAFGYPDAQMKGEIPKPSLIELRYAPIGDDNTLQSIVTVAVGAVMAYAAVAVPQGRGWQRVGVFFCWCKYDSPYQFVEVRLAGVSGEVWSELVLHPSGGGTGEYDREEVHFRVHNRALRRVMSFVSLRRSCQPVAPCLVETRGLSGNQLVTSREHLDATSPPQNAVCTPYEWDEKLFVWKRSGSATKCSKSGTIP